MLSEQIVKPEQDRNKTDAIELLRLLQARYIKDVYNEKKPWSEDGLAEFGTEMASNWKMKIDGQEHNEFLTEIEALRNEVLLTEFESPVYQRTMKRSLERAKLVLEVSDQKKIDQLVFGSAPTGRFNGSVHELGGNPYKVILIEDGVFHNILMLSKLLAMMTPERTWILQSSKQRYSKAKLEKIERSKPIIALRYGELLASIVCYGSSYKSRPYILSKTETELVAKFSALMELFVVMHEIAHTILDHKRSGDDETVMRQEYEADQLAMEYVLRYSDVSGVGRHMAFAAIHSLFHFLSLLESAFHTYDPEMANRRKPLPHPSQRASLVRAMLDEVLKKTLRKRRLALPLGYYSVFLGRVSEKSETLMGAVAAQFGAKPHKKWY